jgi:hypothetical protein
VGFWRCFVGGLVCLVIGRYRGSGDCLERFLLVFENGDLLALVRTGYFVFENREKLVFCTEKDSF